MMKARRRTNLLLRIFVAPLIALFALLPNVVLARSTDQQLDEAYKLLSSGCVVKDDIPFFKGQPNTISREEAGGAVNEKRRFGKSEVQTHTEYGKVFIEHLTVPAESVPDELTAVFKLSLFEFFHRYGVGERRGAREYVYADGLFELAARFENKRLIELKWTCDRD